MDFRYETTMVLHHTMSSEIHCTKFESVTKSGQQQIPWAPNHKSSQLSSLAFFLHDRGWFGVVAIVSPSGRLGRLLVTLVPQRRRPEEVERDGQHRPDHRHHQEGVGGAGLGRAGQVAIRALVVGAVGLGLPEEGEEPPHGHLVVEDAFAGVEAAVRHLEGLLLTVYEGCCARG